MVYQDSSGSWRVQAVGVKGEGFASRQPLPDKWRGVRDEELSKLINIPDVSGRTSLGAVNAAFCFSKFYI